MSQTNPNSIASKGVIVTDPKVNSLLIRLEDANALKANDALGEIFKFPDAADKALPIVERKIDEGTISATISW